MGKELRLKLAGKTSTSGGTMQVIQKRRTQAEWNRLFSVIDNTSDKELLDTLKTIKHPHIGQGPSGIVYELKKTISGYRMVVKVVYYPEGLDSEAEAEGEADNLYRVGQLFGFAHTEDKKYYYFIMPNMGVHWTQTDLTKQQAMDLIDVAKERYTTECGMIHGWEPRCHSFGISCLLSLIIESPT